jgi:hypothetical protein
MWGSVFYILRTALFSKVVMWLAYADCIIIFVVRISHLETNSCLGGMSSIETLLGNEVMLPQDTCLGAWRLNLIRIRRDLVALPNFL